MNIICFSNIDWDFLKQRHQNLMEEFSERDDIENIIFVETLGSRSIKFNKEDLKRGLKKIKNLFFKKNKFKEKNVVSDKITILTPKFIPFYNKLAFEINKNMLKKQLKKIKEIKKIDDNKTITWTMLQHPSILKLLNESNYKKNIFDCIDDIKSIPNVEKIIIKTEEMLIEKSDLVFSTSKTLYDYCKCINPNTYILKNAVSSKFIMHNKSKKTIKSDKKIVGYVGTIYEWFDLEKIIELAKCRPDLEIILAGPVRIDVSELEQYKNVKLLGRISHDKVKDVIDISDVCIIPFKLNDLIINTNPVKVYEYFSRGKVVVSSEIPELFEFKDLLYLYKDNFVECVDMALNEKDFKEKQLKRIEVAKYNTWKARVDKALKLI